MRVGMVTSYEPLGGDRRRLSDIMGEIETPRDMMCMHDLFVGVCMCVFLRHSTLHSALLHPLMVLAEEVIHKQIRNSR